LTASAGRQAKPRRRRTGISVVVPTRNAASWIVACLEAIQASDPGEVILVDGHSDDGTAVLAQPLVDRVIRDDGRGPGPARNLGVAAARFTWIAFVDADVVVPPGGLQALLREAKRRGLSGLQAALRSSGSDYWSSEMARQHNEGRSRSWFGVAATLMSATTAREHPFDDSLRSGEDVDLRLRLAAAEVPLGISEEVVVEHRFAPSFKAAWAQWTADGAGLGRLVRKDGWSGLRYLIIPFAAAGYWLARSILAPRRIPYFAGFVGGNWRGALRVLLDADVELRRDGGAIAIGAALVGLWAGAAVAAALGFAFLFAVASVVPNVPEILREAVWLPALAVITVTSLIWLEIAATLPEGHRWRFVADRYRTRILVVGIVTVLATVLRLAADLRLLR